MGCTHGAAPKAPVAAKAIAASSSTPEATLLKGAQSAEQSKAPEAETSGEAGATSPAGIIHHSSTAAAKATSSPKAAEPAEADTAPLAAEAPQTPEIATEDTREQPLGQDPRSPEALASPARKRGDAPGEEELPSTWLASAPDALPATRLAEAPPVVQVTIADPPAAIETPWPTPATAPWWLSCCQASTA